MIRRIWLSLFATLATGLVLYAQDISGSIGGSILDPTGAAVPNAKIAVTNTDRNQVVRNVISAGDGTYSLPFLTIGTYSIKVEAPGFRVSTRENVKLSVKDQLTINIALEVGSTSEQVTVQEAPVAVELGNPAISSLMDGTQIRELSISTRNYEQLVALIPGVSSDNVDQIFIGNSLPSGLANTIPFSVNGQRNSSNNWTVDGADNVDRGSNLTLLNYPSIDAIAEFKVLRSLYTADSGRAGGAQVQVVTKGGTSEFHGSAYEFIRNDAFAANNWINNANRVNVIGDKAKVSPLRWNNFGFTLGGPIYIPGKYNRDKNKSFFFYSQEFRRIIQYTTFQSTIPTANERKGIFSVPVCIDNTGNTCNQTATQIANINPVAAAYIKDIFSKLPEPPTGNTLFNPGRNTFNHRQELMRFDHVFNEKFTLWGRLAWDTIPTVEPGGIFTGSPIPNGATTRTNSPGHNITIHALNTITPALLNEVGYSYSYGGFISRPIGLTAKENSPGINVNLPFPNTLGVVTALTFTSGSSIVGVGPYDNFSRNHAVFDNLTWIRGRHTFKFGFTANRYLKHENSPNGNNYGTLAFTNTAAPTGTGAFQQAWANFLLGKVGTFTQASKDFTADVNASQVEAYAQDDLRLSSRLALYLGVRWSHFGQPTDGNKVLSNFDPSTFDFNNAAQIDPANGLIIAGTGKALNGLIFQGKSSPYGNKISNDVWTNFAPRIGLTWDPIGDGKNSVRTGYGIYYDSGLFGTYEQSIFTNPPLISTVTITGTSSDNPGGGTATVSRTPVALRATPLPNITPYSQQWSFTLQRMFQRDFVVEAGYTGTKGTNLLGVIDVNQAYPGVAYAAGLKTGAGTIFNTTDDIRINAVRPYRGYNAINTVQPWFNSNYHALQVQVRKRFGDAGQFNLSYTWGRNMTDNASDRSNAPQNTYNFHDGEYGPARLDRRQVFSFNYVYELPFFRSTQHGAAQWLLKGWQFSGNTQYGTGLPYTVSTSSVDPAGLGLLGSSASSARPDQVCDPNLNAPHQFGAAAEGRLWFNTACFAEVPTGEIRPGNAGRFTIRGPGYGKWDLTLSKNFYVTETVKLQLRGESFNVFNHPMPSGFGSTNRTSTLFGRITSFRDPRIIQIAAKLTF
jgi:hypothetical protein